MNAGLERPWKLFSEDGCGKLLKTVLDEFPIVVEYPSQEKIISAIQQGFICFLLTEEERKKINEVIDTSMGSREADIIRQYFGIDQERKTLDKIAENYNLSSQRISQIKDKALKYLRRLSRFSKSKPFQDIIHPVDLLGQNAKLQEEVATLQSSLKEYKTNLQKKNEELVKYQEAAAILAPLVPKTKKEEEEEEEEEKKIPIEELELSVRTSNGLKSAGIKTLGDLCTYTAKRLLWCRNFGRKSLDEITKVLAEHGLSLAE